MYDGLPLLLRTKSWITLPGIHNVGSYGTRAVVKAADGNYESQLGLIVDYNRTGWSKGFGGDYIVTDIPVEGTGRISPSKYILYGCFTEATHVLVIYRRIITFNCVMSFTE